MKDSFKKTCLNFRQFIQSIPNIHIIIRDIISYRLIVWEPLNSEILNLGKNSFSININFRIRFMTNSESYVRKISYEPINIFNRVSLHRKRKEMPSMLAIDICIISFFYSIDAVSNVELSVTIYLNRKILILIYE